MDHARTLDLPYDAYWDIADTVDEVPDISPDRPPPAHAWARLEAYLRSAVEAFHS